MDAVYLYDMDDLQQVVAANLEGRKQEADKPRRSLPRRSSVLQWVATLEVTPTIVALRKRLKGCARRNWNAPWRLEGCPAGRGKNGWKP